MKKYDMDFLAIALFKMKDDFVAKVSQSLQYIDKQNLHIELKKIEKFNTLTADSIIIVRKKIEDDINYYIREGKIDLLKFFTKY